MFRFACHRLLTLRSNRISIRARSSAHGTLNVNEYAVTLCSLAEDAVRVRAGRNFHFHLSLPFLSQLMKKACQRVRTFKTKQHTADLVTDTDKTIEKLLIKGLQKQFPDHV